MSDQLDSGSSRPMAEGSDGLMRTPCDACGSADEEHLTGPSGSNLLLCDDCLQAGDGWWKMAFENVEKWGVQDVETLILATTEELGELSQALLEARAEGGDPARVQDELDDLAALMFQIQLALNKRGGFE